MPVGEQRRSQRQCLGFVPQLIAWTPVGHPLVERIEDRVAALGRVELRRVVERRVVDDGRLAALLDLQQRFCRMRALLPVPESPMMRMWLDSIARGSLQARHFAEESLLESSVPSLEADAV